MTDEQETPKPNLFDVTKKLEQTTEIRAARWIEFVARAQMLGLTEEQIMEVVKCNRGDPDDAWLMLSLL